MKYVVGSALVEGPRPPGQRLAEGRSARKRLPRGQLGWWNPASRGHDPLHTIVGQNDHRLDDLVPIRHGRMAVSPWNYYRGAAAVMAADLASRPNTGLTVQLCGDAHVLNFGLWATPERQLSFDLRDFDETLPGPVRVGRQAARGQPGGRWRGRTGSSRGGAEPRWPPPSTAYRAADAPATDDAGARHLVRPHRMSTS